LLAELQQEGLSMEEADTALEGSLGAWVLNNTLSREIESDAEIRLAQAVGMMITQQFCQYWN
jgi:lambda repressor-like predicted transcriptional regulator